MSNHCSTKILRYHLNSKSFVNILAKCPKSGHRQNKKTFQRPCKRNLLLCNNAELLTILYIMFLLLINDLGTYLYLHLHEERTDLGFKVAQHKSVHSTVRKSWVQLAVIRFPVNRFSLPTSWHLGEQTWACRENCDSVLIIQTQYSVTQERILGRNAHDIWVTERI